MATANVNRMKLISSRAKLIYAKKSFHGKWTEAIVKASTELKKEGKI